MDSKEFGQRIRLARERLGLSQEDLATLVSKDQTAVSEYENGKRKFYVSDLPLFAKALEVPIFYFFSSNELSQNDFDEALLTEFHKLPPEAMSHALQMMQSLVAVYELAYQSSV